jgi:hypothetical protein
MRDAVRSVIERLPLQFRVLYRRFLLRVIDLESLSIEADIPRCLGQFAAVLITISVFQPFVFLVVTGADPICEACCAWGCTLCRALSPVRC